MTNREKKLALAVGAAIFVVMAGVIYKFLFVNKLRLEDRKIATLQAQLQKAHAVRQNHFRNEEIVKAFAQRSFSDQLELASAQSGAMLTREILRCGLAEADFTRLPTGPRKLRGALEVGWSIQGSGPLDRIISLLFVLEKSPFLHRLDNLTLSPSSKDEDVKVRFNFSTLVINTTLDYQPLEPGPLPDLNSPDRKHYDLIVERNFLRPYVEPPPPPPPPEPPPSKPEPPPPSAPGPETFRIVSLSQWQGQPEIHVRDLTQNQTLRYKQGDALAGGVVVMVDYRPLPMPGQSDLKSFSRVIVKIDSEFWAVEKGQTLAEIYKLAPDQLPPDLPSS